MRAHLYCPMAGADRRLGTDASGVVRAALPGYPIVIKCQAIVEDEVLVPRAPWRPLW